MFHKSNKGFTLIETLIALGVSSIIIIAIYQMFHNQQKSFLIQDQVVVMQQNARAGIYFMTKELRSAGFDPDGSNLFGFVTDFEAPNDIFGTDIDYSTERTRVAFTLDDDEDGVIDINDNELIAYQHSPSENTILKYSVQRNNWDLVATNIEALDLVYLDRNGNVTVDPDEFHAVQLSIVSRAKYIDIDYNNLQTFENKQGESICPTCLTKTKFRRRFLSTTIRIRNS